MKHFSPSTRLLYTDTDSFILRCKKSWFKDMQHMQDEFDFSKASARFINLLGLNQQDISKTKGQLGKYKSEIDKDSVLLGFIGLQKKSYSVLILTKYKCSKCKEMTAVCKCDKNYRGIQLYYIQSKSTAKGKNVKLLNFESYLTTMTSNSFSTELRCKFEQKNKQTVMSLKKMRSLSKFDDSNFTRSCGVHNLQFSSNNRDRYLCDIVDCGATRKSINILKDALPNLFLHLYYFNNGNLQIWTNADDDK